jgi:hypothetical protein
LGDKGAIKPPPEVSLMGALFNNVEEVVVEMVSDDKSFGAPLLGQWVTGSGILKKPSFARRSPSCGSSQGRSGS